MFDRAFIKLNSARVPGGCWLWIPRERCSGYGRVNGLPGRPLAHRVSYEIHSGPVPVGLFVLHKCDVRDCVNPKHLFVGTRSDNMKDMHAKGRWKITKEGSERLAAAAKRVMPQETKDKLSRANRGKPKPPRTDGHCINIALGMSRRRHND